MHIYSSSEERRFIFALHFLWILRFSIVHTNTVGWQDTRISLKILRKINILFNGKAYIRGHGHRFIYLNDCDIFSIYFFDKSQSYEK